MRKDLKFILASYKEEERKFNEIVISLFLHSNKITKVNNDMINSLLLPLDKMDTNFLSFSPKMSFHDVIEAFELGIPDRDRTVNGAVYTPDFIKEFIVNESLKKIKKPLDKLVSGDISCGCGAFLYTLAIKIKERTKKTYFDIFRDNLFGLDINQSSIERTEILLSLLAVSNGEDLKSFEFNLFCSNALSFDWFKSSKKISVNNGFDLIVGNPPYVRSKNIDKKSKDLLHNWCVTKTGNPDLYIPFFEIGLNNLNKNGHLGYITVNSFYKSVNARALRDYFSKNSFGFEIIDFGHEKIFGNKSTYTCICLISKEISAEVLFSKSDSKNLLKNTSKNKIEYKSLDSHSGWMLHNAHTLKNIKKMESTGISLDKLFSIKNGIATLSNNTYIFKPEKELNGNYYFTRNGKEYLVEKNICRDIIKPNLLKYESEIPSLKEKIIYPYKNSKMGLTVIPEKVFQKNHPNAYSYLQDHKTILASRDKGEGDYTEWFSYGRTQALMDRGYKLLFPYMSKTPYFVFTDQEDLMIYCGYAIFSESKETLLVIKKILESSVFDYYMKNTSKPYSGGYLSYAKNYVKNFTICDLSKSEFDYLLSTQDKEEINNFIIQKYKVYI